MKTTTKKLKKDYSLPEYEKTGSMTLPMSHQGEQDVIVVSGVWSWWNSDLAYWNKGAVFWQ